MAIFGAGSNWDGKEVSEDFFRWGKFTIGWNEATGRDLYSVLASLKIGDIIYLKANRPGSRQLRVKGIGLVTKHFIQCLQDDEYQGDFSSWESFFINVAWILRDEFILTIPSDEGRLTNIRAATFYEEPLPFVQSKILDKIASAFPPYREL